MLDVFLTMYKIISVLNNACVFAIKQTLKLLCFGKSGWHILSRTLYILLTHEFCMLLFELKGGKSVSNVQSDAVLSLQLSMKKQSISQMVHKSVDLF